eukprot:scaffold104323_cov61-Attheya_sp.AAC.4
MQNATETESHYFACTENQQTNDNKLHCALVLVFNKHKIDLNLRKLTFQGLTFAVAEEINNSSHIRP